MKNILTRILLALVVLYIVLLIPEFAPRQSFIGEDRVPFTWNQDDYWRLLEAKFLTARADNPTVLADKIDAGLDRLNFLTDSLAKKEYYPDDRIFDRIETSFFELSTEIAAAPDRFPELLAEFNRLRKALKIQSCAWDMNDSEVRTRLYRLLYGCRTAMEQVMMQGPEDSLPALTTVEDYPSGTPSAKVLGVTIHSGDILVSRGGAPTSALIARGNDYPGNFSHAALVYVDSKTSLVSVLEAHIEKGVTISTLEQYLNDTKLRVMSLRLRPDLPALIKDPLLPHNVATLALERVKRERIPYDFQMDFSDTSKYFCSEVVSHAYRRVGIELWMGLSHISSPGVKSWLSAFGVTHFQTQEPSDLEYDPQLVVTAEWRDPETLSKDQLDNAVVDVMLEGAEKGEKLNYDWYLLPIARVMKVYSAGFNKFGKVGPVPEGMSPASALRNKWFTSRHEKIKSGTAELAEKFKTENGYMPPYWQLVNLAREAKRKVFP